MKRRLCMLVLGVAALLSVGTAAWAFWGNVGVGGAVAATGSLTAPANLTASAPLNSSTVAVGWTGASLGTGQPATGYFVTRIRDYDSAAFPACGTSLSSPTASLGCDDPGVTDGGYHYTVTGLFGSWTAVSASSNSVTVVNDTSLPNVTVTSISPTPNGNGYNNSSPVVVNLLASAGRGITSITYTIDAGPSVVVMADTAAVSAVGDDIHTITFTARDNVGNDSETGSVFVRIDTVIPAAPSAPALAAASDTGSSSSDLITNAATPTFTGTAEDGSTITLFDGATPVGTVVATGGAYAVMSSALISGTQTMTTTATDIAGNQGPASASTTITIDTTAPAAPTAPILAAASDSGSSSTDRITNVTTPTFTGTAENGSTVTLYNGGTPVGTALTTGGSYTVTSSALTTGTKTMTVAATDVAGNVGLSSASTSITIDVTAPGKPGTPTLNAANDTGRSATDGITKVTTPTFTGTATAGTIVVLYDGATVVGSVSTATTSYSITSSALANGGRTITTKATDAAGNVSAASTGKTVTIDSIAPAAPSAPALTAASDTGVSATDRITKATAPIFTGTNETTAIVIVYDGATPVGSKTTTTATYSVTSSILSSGSHTLTATATDVAGNLGPASGGTTITIDTTPPAAPSVPTLTAASDTGISSSDGITKTKTPTFTGTAEVGITVTLFDGATATGAGVTATGGIYNATTASLATGTHTITAKATDVAGNAAASPGTSVTIDFTVPTVTINQAVGQADPTTATTINYTAVFSEGVYGLAGSGITFTGTAGANTATITGSGTTFNVAISGMTKTGTVIPKITASKETDAAGNVNSVSTTTDSTVTYSDVTAPAAASAPMLTVASDTGISSTDGITKIAAATFTGTAEAGATVALFDGATATGTAVIATGGGIYTATSGTLATGSHTITAKATDPSGNAGPASTGTIVTIDTTAPTVTINQAAGQADPTTATPINFTAVFSESVYGLAGSGITFTGTALPSTATISGSGTTFNVAVTGMTKTGTVIPKVAAGAAQDAAGNLNTISTTTDGTVTYTDSSAPSVGISSFAPGPSQSATASGTAGFGLGDSASVTVVVCSVNVFPCLAGNTIATLTPAVNPATGGWSATSGVLGVNLTLFARATQTDLTGNIGQSSVVGPISTL